MKIEQDKKKEQKQEVTKTPRWPGLFWHFSSVDRFGHIWLTITKKKKKKEIHFPSYQNTQNTQNTLMTRLFLAIF